MGDYIMSDAEIVNTIVSKVAKAGNRSERRKILKALNKTRTIEKYTSKMVNKKADEEVMERSNKSFGTILSAVGLALHYDYKWSDDDIGDFFQNVSNRISNCQDAEELVKELEEVTGIELVVT